MPVEMTGAEFKSFGLWLEGQEYRGFMEEECVYVGDADDPLESVPMGYLAQIADTDKVTLVGGYWMEAIDNTISASPIDLESKARAWLSKHRSEDAVPIMDSVLIMVRVPRDRVDPIKAAIAGVGDFYVGVAETAIKRD